MLKTSALFALLFSIVRPFTAFAQAGAPEYWGWPGPWHMWGGMGFWWLFPLLMMIVFVALCAFFMSRMFGGHSHGGGDTTSSALKLLNERFARGEISKEEFQEKRTMLGGAS